MCEFFCQQHPGFQIFLKFPNSAPDQAGWAWWELGGSSRAQVLVEGSEWFLFNNIFSPVTLEESLYWDNSALTSLNRFYSGFWGLSWPPKHWQEQQGPNSSWIPFLHFLCVLLSVLVLHLPTKPAQGFLLLVASEQEKANFRLFPVMIWRELALTLQTRQSFWAQTSSKNFSLWNVSFSAFQCKLPNPSWIGVASELSRFELLLFCNCWFTEQ